MIFKKKKEELYKKASKIALDNSQKMYDEAKILHNKEHYARGLALGITSLEESAKAFLFRLISLNLYDEHKTMKFVHDHEDKLQQSSQILSFSTKLIGFIFDSIIWAHKTGLIKGNINEIPKNYKQNLAGWEEVAKHIAKTHHLKLDSFYVDVREGKVINPNDIITKEELSEMLDIFKIQMFIVETFVNMSDSQVMAVWKEPIGSSLKIDNLLKPSPDT